MILKRNEVDACLTAAKSNNKALPRAWLLYGPNEGLARYYEQRVLAAALGYDSEGGIRRKSSLAGNHEGVVRVNLQALTKSGEKLRDMLCSPSLFGGKKIVLLEVSGADKFDARAVFADCLEELSKDEESKNGDSILIVRGQALRKDAVLRKIFEEKATVFACYEERSSDVIPMIKAVLHKEQIEVEDHLLQAMGEILCADRMAAKQELEKVILYYGTGGKIDEQVWELLSEWRETRIGEILYDAFDGRSVNCARALGRLKVSQINGIVLVRSVVRHIQCLTSLAARSREDSAKLRSAIAGWRPFVLFHLRERLSSQVRRWNSRNLYRLLGDGIDCEKLIKRKPKLQWTLAERYVLGIAKRAEANNRRSKI